MLYSQVKVKQTEYFNKEYEVYLLTVFISPFDIKV